MITRRTVLGLLVAVVVCSGCAPRHDVATPPPAATTDATPDAIAAAATYSAIAVGPRPGQAAIDLTLPTIDGASITLSELEGRAVVVIFWASWCAYCRQELATLVEVYEEAHEKGLEVLAINTEEEPERVVAFAAEHRLPYPVLLDHRGEVATRYRVLGLPTTVFIDAEGIVQHVHPGIMEAAVLQEYVDAVLPSEVSP
ncbi:MAG TPA: TlpA family protein disulfide reductase [Chloroflexi bacterium]|jgi:cytochrome c biogenesis protein CcmG/thiol:disulfide interchange protein DsbE|nr:TlpA family protein disulfide reductase [Chloroflexota bacterium]